MTRWICTEACRTLGRSFNKDNIIEHPTNPASAYFDEYLGEVVKKLDAQDRIDLDETMYLPHLAWDDMTFSITQTKIGSNLKPDTDYTELGFLFPQDQPLEKIYVAGQFSHKMFTGSGASIKPHIHWRQESAELPVWTMEYRLHKNGAAEGSWVTGVVQTHEAFTYVDGTITQISMFPRISVEGLATSALFNFIVYRNDDIVLGDVLMRSFDFHYQIDSYGSGGEYNK